MTLVTTRLTKSGLGDGDIWTGFKDLDHHIGGLHAEDLVVIGGVEGVGKTALLLQMIERCVLPKKGEAQPALLFNLAMGERAMAQRFIYSRALINAKLLRDGLYSRNGEEMQRLLQVADQFAKAPLAIHNGPSLEIRELCDAARTLHAKDEFKMVGVDSIQMIHAPYLESRDQQVDEIMRQLKGLAKELDVCVVATCGIKREAKNQQRAIRAADLRDSGSVEDLADVVLLLEGPRDVDDRFTVASDSVDLKIAKNRMGSPGEFKLTLLREIMRFENFTQ